MKKREVVWLLLAKGLIQAKAEDTMEDTAENIIKQLDGLGMLQDFDDGSRVKVCQLYKAWSKWVYIRETKLFIEPIIQTTRWI